MKPSKLLFNICLLLTVMLSLLACAGWIFDYLSLASLSEFYIPMAPLTAFSFLLLSTAITIISRTEKFRWLIFSIIIILVIFSLNTLLGVADLPALPIEARLISHEKMFGLVPIGRMSPITAVLFISSALSLFFLQRKKKYGSIWIGILSVFIFFTALVILVGYLYNTPIFYGDTTIPIAITTGLCFLFTSIALFICNGFNSFPLFLFYGPQTYTRLLRAFIPLTAFLIMAGGTFQVYLKSRYLANEAITISIVVISAMILVTIVTIYLSKIISNQIDRVESEKSRLQSIIEVTTDLVIIQDEKGKPLYLNKAMLAIMGLPDIEKKNNLTMASIFSLQSTDLIQNTAIPMAREQGFWKGESNIVASDGTEFPVSHVILYHQGNKQETAYYSSVLRDIREIKASHQKIEAINQQLIVKNNEMQEFVYALSHDLSEPLRMVSSFLQLTRMRIQDKLDTETTQFMDYATGGAQRMNSMIKDLLELSKTGGANQHFTVCHTKILIEEALTNLLPIIRENDVTITIAENLPTLPVITSLLTRLFQNLVSNAIKYKSDKKCVIEISVKEYKDEYCFSVSDNGIGIATEHFKDIFKIFKRLTTDRPHNGSGIGLAICKKIVDMHHGNIWVESTPGKGSAFYFTLKKDHTSTQN
ncbi:MAG: PAS domain-containing sensor histidine kinase [Cytophagia bacterium]|nr:PAS domain-containing sensor histidine kinase [Cytophagia bacterium]